MALLRHSYRHCHKPSHLQTRSAFTLIEILLVILVMSVLFLAMRQSFQPQQQAVIYSEICVNNIAADVRSHLNNAITSRSLSGNASHQQYSFLFDPNTQTIHLGYDSLTDTTLLLSGGVQYCSSPGYNVFLTGSQLSFTVTKGGTHSELSIDNTAAITGTQTFSLCQSGQCEDFFRLVFDKRTATITRQSCLSFRDTCLKRQ